MLDWDEKRILVAIFRPNLTKIIGASDLDKSLFSTQSGCIICSYTALYALLLKRILYGWQTNEYIELLYLDFYLLSRKTYYNTNVKFMGFDIFSESQFIGNLLNNYTRNSSKSSVLLLAID
jgi:hypothetical protein